MMMRMYVPLMELTFALIIATLHAAYYIIKMEFR